MKFHYNVVITFSYELLRKKLISIIPELVIMNNEIERGLVLKLNTMSSTDPNRAKIYASNLIACPSTLDKEFLLNLVSGEPGSLITTVLSQLSVKNESTKTKICGDISKVINEDVQTSIIDPIQSGIYYLNKLAPVFKLKYFKTQEEKDSYLFCIDELNDMSHELYNSLHLGYDAIKRYLENLDVVTK